MTTDHLGSPRIITDQSGAVVSRKDFTAFGEEIASSQRVSGTSGNGYDDPTIRQDFTGYQKDGESGLEFAQARYYNSGHGRFTSVDPLPASATIRNPQSFNRYSYSLNSPYKFADPLGLFPMGGGGCSRYGGTCLTIGGDDWWNGDGGYRPSLLPASNQIQNSSTTSSTGTGNQTSSSQPAPPPTPQAEQNNSANQADSSNDSNFKVTSALANNIKEAALVKLAEVAPQVAFAVGRSLLGNPVQNPSPLFNCLAWALGFIDRWVQPGAGGKTIESNRGPIQMIDRSQGRKRITDTIGDNYTPGTAPDAFGMRHNGGWVPAGMRILTVFEDSGDPGNWHVMRQEANGTWSSKNGDSYLFGNIKNPDLFYRVYYPVKGKVTTTKYLVPAF